MQFHYIVYAIPLLADNKENPLISPASEAGKLSYLSLKIKLTLYGIAKKIGYLSLATLFTNNALAIEAGDMKNTPSSEYPSGTDYRCLIEPMTGTNFTHYINFAKASAPASRIFDYDPSLLPDVAEAIFALRIKHTNINAPYVINLSGNYLLKFTKDKIYVLDTYNKNMNVYTYQTNNPNITIGLFVSKGLPQNYKRIIIKEDANGKLYEYSALCSLNIFTDDIILSETLRHPFYEVIGKDGVEDKVTISKAMALYHKLRKHEPQAQCVPSKGVKIDFLKDVFTSAVGCQPESAFDNRSTNHKSVESMRLDQPLIEAPFDEGKFRETVGYRLKAILDLGGKDPVALLTAAYYCNELITGMLKNQRRKRDLDSGGRCVDWVFRMVLLYRSLGLKFGHINQIVNSIREGHGIPSHFFPPHQPPVNLAHVEELEHIITAHIGLATYVLQLAAAETGDAAAANPEIGTHNQGAAATPEEVQNTVAVAEERLGHYTLVRGEFISLPNQVRTLNSHLQQVVHNGEGYTTKIIHMADANSDMQSDISSYRGTMRQWANKIRRMRHRANAEDSTQLEPSFYMAGNINYQLGIIEPGSNTVISTVSHSGNLIGITIGRINGRVYRLLFALVSPDSLLQTEGAYRGAVAYLRSEVLRYLFSNDLIDSAVANVVSRHVATSVLKIGFKYQHQHQDEHEHDEL